jgi:hypothetical protein
VAFSDRRLHRGRAVAVRAEVMRQAGIDPATAQNWYRDRTNNGYPAPVLAVGRRLYYDEVTLLAWVEAQLSPAPPPARILRRGRTLVTRDELVRLTGLSEPALADLYTHRATTGHPEAVHRDRRHLYFDERDVLAWHLSRPPRVDPAGAGRRPRRGSR